MGMDMFVVRDVSPFTVNHIRGKRINCNGVLRESACFVVVVFFVLFV